VQNTSAGRVKACQRFVSVVHKGESAERQQREQVTYRRKRFRQQEVTFKRIADHVDGYDRDDLGESPDY
jgi:hypothetical protein